MRPFQKRKVVACVLAALLFLAVTASTVSDDVSLASAQQQQQESVQTQQEAEEVIVAVPANHNESNNLDAQQIYETNSIIADSDVKTLVVTIPDNAGTGESSWEGFLPSHATVAIDTALVVLNADVNVTHTITVSNAETGQSVTRELPYKNTTGILLESPGEYVIRDEALQISGTVEVVENSTLVDDPITNASKPAVGLFIAPASAKSDFEAHLNRLGFNAVSSYNFSSGGASTEQNTSPFEADEIENNGNDNNSPNNSREEEEEMMMTLFVWTQEVAHPNTIDGRLASKIQTLEEALYPDNITKYQQAGMPQVAE